MESKYEAQCAACRGLIEVGEEITYLAPSGDLPAVVKHKVCPEKPIKLHRSDPEERWSLRDCECGQVWAVEKGTLTPKVFPCCEERIAA